jgi:hypothetical protein
MSPFGRAETSDFSRRWRSRKCYILRPGNSKIQLGRAIGSIFFCSLELKTRSPEQTQVSRNLCRPALLVADALDGVLSYGAGSAIDGNYADAV